jgi:ATP-binding cassette subfamily B protein
MATPSPNGRPNTGRRAWLQERWRQVRDAFDNVRKAFGLVWEAHAPATASMAGLSLAGALLPAAQAWTGKLIVDAVVAAVNARVAPWDGLSAILPYLLLEFGLLVAGATIQQGRSLVEHILHARLNYQINTAIMRKSLELDLSFFENPAFYDKLQNARREADFRALRIVDNGFYLVQNTITLLSYAVLVVRFSPWLALLLFGATIPAFLAQNHFAQLHFRLLTWRAPEARRLAYLEYLLTVDDSAKEVKLFGLGEPLLGRYAELFWKFLREDEQLARRRSLVSLGWGLVAMLTYYLSYAWIVYHAAAGWITLFRRGLRRPERAVRERPVHEQPVRLPGPRAADGHGGEPTPAAGAPGPRPGVPRRLVPLPGP